MSTAESGLEQERRRLLEQLLAEEGLDAPQVPAILPRDPSALTPLTFAQEVLWLLDRATPGLTAYNTPLARRVTGSLDVAALERALAALVERHETLRTVFEAHQDGAVQVVQPPRVVRVALHDVSDQPPGSREAAAIAALRSEADTPFDLASEPGFRVALARLSAHDHILLLLTHHIVSDAWSYGVIFRELSALYDGTALPHPALQYGDYAAWQRATLRGEALEQGLVYWRERLAALPTLELPTEFPRPAHQGFAGARRRVLLPPESHAAIRVLAQRAGATTYMVLLAAYATVLRRYSAQDDIVIGSAVAGRIRHEMEAMVGYFSQALPMRVRFDGDPTFDELLERVSETVLGAFEHQDTPLETLVLELQRGRTQPPAPLFRVVLTMQDTLGAELSLGTAAISPVELDASSTKFDLTILATERADGLELTLWYRTDLFTAGFSDRFLGHLRTVLVSMLGDSSRRVSAIPLVTEEERAQFAAWNDTHVDEGAPMTIAELFEAQVTRVPERVAVVAPSMADESSTAVPCALTYAALNARANQLAYELRQSGVGPDVPVGLLLDRSVEAIVGLVGILKAGGCYVPLSEDAPAVRLAGQLGECGAMVVVTTSALAHKLPVGVASLELDSTAPNAHPDANLAPLARADSLAYVLYTSGSTGVPKGVAVTNANAVHYTRGISRVLSDMPSSRSGDGLAALDGWRFGLGTTLSADLGNTSLLGALLSGGTLHVLPKDVATDPANFAEYSRMHTLHVLKLTPNHLMALLAGRTGAQLAEALPTRWVVVGGEVLRPDVARALLSARTCRLLNHYGPTETTVGALTFNVTASSLDTVASLGAQTVPLGYPLPNMRTYVVDAHGNEQPIAIPGELVLAGAGVARGYLKRPDLTAQRFKELRGDRAYWSGDRVRRLANGAIEFLGRTDDQVKVRGFRVELGEIISVLHAHPGVDRAEVVLRRKGDESQLVAYVVPKPGGYAVSHAERPLAERLREWVEASLPEYMVPGLFVQLERMPLTANGKVDRNALPEPEADGAVSGDQHVAPRTATEEQMCAIWADVLKKERIGVRDNFLALGGHSLLAIRVLGKISKAFGVRLPLRSLFETPTVEALSAAIDRARSAS